MNTEFLKSVMIAFRKDIFTLEENTEELFDEWWERTGKKQFKQSLPLNKNILEQANDIIFKRDEEKDRQYGPFSDSMSKAARVATEMCNKEITTEDFFKCMIALKISRMAYNHKHDTMLDAIGYIAGLDDYLKNKIK